MTDKILVLSNCGSETEAQAVARSVVESRLAACVNTVPGVRSIYMWQGKMEETQEWTLLIKSRRELFEKLSAEIRRVHSYSTPEIIAIPIVDGNPDYLEWIDAETPVAQVRRDVI